jgi:hypothetical protein
MKKYLWHVRAYLWALALSAIVFIAESTTLFVGRIINQIHPCVEHPEITSFPCYLKIDLYVIGAAAILFALAFFILLVSTVRYVAPKK